MNKYQVALKKHVCSICCDSDDKGRCTLGKEEVCAIDLYTDEMVEIIHNYKNDDYDGLYKEIKEKICKNCKARSEDGHCHLKEDANCSLDRYFYLIVDIVNKVDLGKI